MYARSGKASILCVMLPTCIQSSEVGLRQRIEDLQVCTCHVTHVHLYAFLKANIYIHSLMHKWHGLIHMLCRSEHLGIFVGRLMYVITLVLYGYFRPICCCIYHLSIPCKGEYDRLESSRQEVMQKLNELTAHCKEVERQHNEEAANCHLVEVRTYHLLSSVVI